jgi:hypothetical protein
VARRNDNAGLVIITAGHCIDAHGGFDEIWDHNNDSFGRALRETWVENSSRNADVGLIYIFSAEYPSIKSQIHTGGGLVRAVVNWADA